MKEQRENCSVLYIPTDISLKSDRIARGREKEVTRR